MFHDGTMHETVTDHFAAPTPDRAGTRVVIAAPRGALTAAVVKAALVERLGVPAPVCAESVAEAADLLPADVLLVDSRLAGESAGELSQVIAQEPGLLAVGLADRPDDAAVTCLQAAGLADVVMATDGQAAIALRLRVMLHRAAETARAPVVPAAATHDDPDTMMRGLAAQLEQRPQADPEQIRELEIELDRRLMDVAILGGVARAIASGDEPLREVCEAGRRLLDAHICLLAAPCAAGDSLVVAAAGDGVHPGDVAAPGGAPDLAAGLNAGERLFVADAREHPHVPQQIVTATGVVSVIIEPVLAGDTLLGALVLGWKERTGDPGAHDNALLRALSAQAANALERGALIETMRDIARVDPLTGLPNRAAWDERLEAEISRAARTGEPLAMLLLDVDDFGAYNRRYGRGGGDALLRALGAGWRRPLRATDVIARIGADEFAILLPSCSPDDAEMIAERINAETVGLATFGAVLTAWDGSSNAALTMARAESALAQAREAQQIR